MHATHLISSDNLEYFNWWYTAHGTSTCTGTRVKNDPNMFSSVTVRMPHAQMNTAIASSKQMPAV